MAYSERLAERVRAHLEQGDSVLHVSERKMFGGLAFMVGGNMAVGILGDELMVRVGPEAYEATLKVAHARPMDFTGKPMRGYVYVGAAGMKDAKGLAQWVDRGVSFARSLPRK